MQQLLAWTLTLTGCLAVALIAANAWVVTASRDYVYSDPALVPANRVGLVLGTSPYTRDGGSNLLFGHRIRAAAELYAAGKVRHLLLSGANPSSHYNEPRKMYQALAAAGVPDRAMTLDFAGFRTLDSVVRAQQVFELRKFTIISQRFHDYRAVFIARHNGIDAVAYGFAGEDRRQALRIEAREFLARAKAVLDLFVFDSRPRFLGEKRRLPLDAEPPAKAGHTTAETKTKAPG